MQTGFNVGAQTTGSEIGASYNCFCLLTRPEQIDLRMETRPVLFVNESMGEAAQSIDKIRIGRAEIQSNGN